MFRLFSVEFLQLDFFRSDNFHGAAQKSFRKLFLQKTCFFFLSKTFFFFKTEAEVESNWMSCGAAAAVRLRVEAAAAKLCSQIEICVSWQKEGGWL